MQLKNHESYLPTKLEDLTKFVLIGREKLASVRAEIRAIDKIGLAKEVREQKREEASYLADALLDAETRIGELLKNIPGASGIRTDLEPCNPGDTRLKEHQANELGLSRKQASQFQRLADNKDIVEQVKAEARENDDLPTRSEVLRKIREKDRAKDLSNQREEIKKINLDPLKGSYSVIVIDPPWNYGREYNPQSSRVASPYPEMTTDELKELSIPSDDDSVLFLWTTHQFIWDAKELLDLWGFTYKATIVWDKQKIGMGVWLRMQCEFCLVGVKGKPYWHNTTYRDIISEPRRGHSRKPDLFYKMVEEITEGKRLDYFSRQNREGWETFGNDTNKY